MNDSFLKHFVLLMVNFFINTWRWSIRPLFHGPSINSIHDMLNKGSSTQLIRKKNKNIAIFTKESFEI